MGNSNSCIIDEKYRTLSKSQQNKYYPKLRFAEIDSRQTGMNEYEDYPYVVYDWCQAKKGEDLEDLKITKRKIIVDKTKNLMRELEQKAIKHKRRFEWKHQLNDPNYFPRSQKMVKYFNGKLVNDE